MVAMPTGVSFRPRPRPRPNGAPVHGRPHYHYFASALLRELLICRARKLRNRPVQSPVSSRGLSTIKSNPSRVEGKAHLMTDAAYQITSHRISVCRLFPIRSRAGAASARSRELALRPYVYLCLSRVLILLRYHMPRKATTQLWLPPHLTPARTRLYFRRPLPISHKASHRLLRPN